MFTCICSGLVTTILTPHIAGAFWTWLSSLLILFLDGAR
jgi:hypothetical protein